MKNIFSILLLTLFANFSLINTVEAQKDSLNITIGKAVIKMKLKNYE